jgi:hypothetical protein
MAIDALFEQLYGPGVIVGMALSSSGVIGAGYALVGHVIEEPGGTNLASLFTGSGIFDLYVQQPAGVYSSAGLATGGVVGAGGCDAAEYAVVPTGVAPAQGGAILATVTVSGGVIQSVADKRTLLVSPQSLVSLVSRVWQKETAFYGELSAPLPSALLFMAPSALHITGIALRTTVAPEGQAIIAQVQKNGVDVWTSGQGYPEIAAGQLLGTASAPAGAFACAQWDLISLQLTQVGTSAPGTSLVVVLSFEFV